MLAGVLFGLLSMAFSDHAAKAYVVPKQIIGNVQQMDLADGQITQIELDQTIQGNHRVISGSDGYVVFDVLGAQLELDAFTSIVLNIDESDSGAVVQLDLEVGRVNVSGGQGNLYVHTPSGTATPNGSDGVLRVVVELNSAGTMFDCLQGTCQVSNQTGMAVFEAGQRVSLTSITAPVADSLVAYPEMPEVSGNEVALLPNKAAGAVNVDNVDSEPIILIDQPQQEHPTVQPEAAVPAVEQPEEIPPAMAPIEAVPAADAPFPTATSEPPVVAAANDDNTGSESTEPEIEPAFAPVVRAADSDIGDIDWEMVYFGDPLSLNSIPDGLGAMFRYDDAEQLISGNMGCNRFRGKVTFQDNVVQVIEKPSSVTKLVCSDGVMNFEGLFTTLLGEMTTYEMTDSELTINTMLDWVMVFQIRESEPDGENTRQNIDITVPSLPTTESPVVENTFYVDAANGSDNNPGTQASPWKSIQKAADSLSAGETVIVQAGNYSERVNVRRSGAADKFIVFKAQGTVVTQGFTVNADYVEIRGFEITSTPNDSTAGFGIYVTGSQCVLAENYVHYATRGGIMLEDSSSGCSVKNNRLYRNSQYGIEVRGNNHRIISNEIWKSIQHHPDWKNAPSWVDADGIRFFGSGHLFRGNYIHDISLDQSENINPHIDAFQTWDEDGRRAGQNCVFEQNVIKLGRTAAGFQLEGAAKNLTIRNNIVMVYSGALAYKNGQSPYSTPSNLYFYNNLFIGSLSYRNNGYPVGLAIYNTDTVVIKNNMFINQPDAAIYMENNSGVDMDYNLFYNSDGSAPGTNRQAHDLWLVDPKFVDFDGGNYRLQSDSPAINAGVAVDVSNDFAGNPRPAGGVYDIGVYETK